MEDQIMISIFLVVFNCGDVAIATSSVVSHCEIAEAPYWDYEGGACTRKPLS